MVSPQGESHPSDLIRGHVVALAQAGVQCWVSQNRIPRSLDWIPVSAGMTEDVVGSPHRSWVSAYLSYVVLLSARGVLSSPDQPV